MFKKARCKKRVTRYKLYCSSDKLKFQTHEQGEYVTYRDYKLLVKNMQTQVNQHKYKIAELQKQIEELSK